MTLMKKTLLNTVIALVSLAGLTVIIFFLNPAGLADKIPYFSQFRNNTSLIIKTSKGVASVQIDGEDHGETPLELTTLKPGSHQIKMTRLTQQEDIFYEPMLLTVDLNNNTEAIIDLEIAPLGRASGYLLYYTIAPFGESGMGHLTVSANTEATLTSGGVLINNVPTGLLDMEVGEHNLKVTAPGYEEVLLPIVIREGYNLNIQTYLLPVPINLETAQDGNEEG